MINIKEYENGIVVSVKVQPNSSKDQVIGKHADQIKISVSAAPEKGKANRAVIKVLSQWLGIKDSDIQIISGETSRVKKVFIRDISETNITGLLNI